MLKKTVLYIVALSCQLVLLFYIINLPTQEQKTSCIKNEYIIIVPAERKEHFYKNVQVTAYTARTAECDKTPHVTAIMEKPIPGYTVAVSRDFMQYLGRRVYIPGVGVRRVNDLMNARYKKRIDVLMPSVEMARAFGKKIKNVVFF